MTITTFGESLMDKHLSEPAVNIIHLDTPVLMS